MIAKAIGWCAKCVGSWHTLHSLDAIDWRWNVYE